MNHIQVCSDSKEIVDTLRFVAKEMGFNCEWRWEPNPQKLLSLCTDSRPKAVFMKTEWYLTVGLTVSRKLEERGLTVLHNKDIPSLELLFENTTKRPAPLYILSIEKGLNEMLRMDSTLAKLDDNSIRYVTRYHESLATERRPLSAMEQNVLRELTRGHSYKIIGSILNISTETVKTHIKNIHRKLGVNTSTAAVAAAYERGLLDDLPTHSASEVTNR